MRMCSQFDHTHSVCAHALDVRRMTYDTYIYIREIPPFNLSQLYSYLSLQSCHSPSTV